MNFEAFIVDRYREYIESRITNITQTIEQRVREYDNVSFWRVCFRHNISLEIKDPDKCDVIGYVLEKRLQKLLQAKYPNLRVNVMFVAIGDIRVEIKDKPSLINRIKYHLGIPV